MRTIDLRTSARLLLLSGTAFAAFAPSAALAATPDETENAAAEAAAQPVPDAVPEEEVDSNAADA